MKKLLTIVLCLAILLSISACENAADTSSSKNSDVATQSFEDSNKLLEELQKEYDTLEEEFNSLDENDEKRREVMQKMVDNLAEQSKYIATINAKESDQSATNSSQNNTNDNNFEQYNILSFELLNDDRTSYDDEIIETYVVTNNSKYSLKYLTIDVVYYDASDNIICKDSRFNDVLLAPGKSVEIKSYSSVNGDKDKIAYSSVVSYDYIATENINVDYNGADVNLQTQEIKFNNR